MATSAKRSRPKMNLTGPSDRPKPRTAPEPPPVAPPPPQQVNDKPRQQSRVGKRAVTFYVNDDAFRQLGVLSAQTDRTVQDLMQEALDWQFQQHDMHRIAKQ